MEVWIENPFDNLPVEGFRPQRYWLMAEAFARAGHSTTLWTADFNHTTKAPRSISLSGEIPFRLSLVHEPPYPSNVSLARIRSHVAYARNWLKAATEKARQGARPDVVVASLPTIGSATAAMRLRDATGCRVVIDIMDAWPDTFVRLALAPLRKAFSLLLSPLRKSAERAIREADLVTGVADAYGAVASAAGARRFLRFYHGISMQPEIRREPRKPGTTRLAYAGGLGRTYDLATAVAAVEMDESLTLDIAGTGEAEPSLKAAAAKCGGRVRFHGYLRQDELRKMLASCDAGLVPMTDDSFVGVPYKLADYAEASLAIVSSLGGESAALIEKSRCGAVYEAGNASSLSAAVRNLPPDAGTAARRLAEREFDAARIYGEYVAALPF